MPSDIYFKRSLLEQNCALCMCAKAALTRLQNWLNESNLLDRISLGMVALGVGNAVTLLFKDLPTALFESCRSQ